MVGARPEYISLALILEEGLERTILEKIVDSIAKIAKVSGVFIVTGDLKVVERGACDKIFITTSGIGRIITRRRLSVRNIKPGDRIIITGGIAEHGLAVLAGRQDLSLGLNIKSDCAALNRLLIPILGRTDAIRFMRDPTRGGLAATLNEIAEGSGCGISINEKQIPVAGKVRAACELLGIDPLHMANEGKAVLIVRKQNTDKLLVGLRKHPLGRLAREIGTVTKAHPGQVVLKTVIGTERIVDMLTGEPLPRIC
jgi:hydrogenase expression/formation protein HypE